MPDEDVPEFNLRMTPLIGAVRAGNDTLTLFLLSLPDQELDLNRRLDKDVTILHLCAQLGSASVAKELMRQGADLDLWEEEHETPLCIAAKYARLTLIQFFLRQYQKRGQSELERALDNPCRKHVPGWSLLGYVLDAAPPDSFSHVHMARLLVREFGVDVWKPINTTCSPDGDLLPLLPLHIAAYIGARRMRSFFIEECGMPVDAALTNLLTPLHVVSMGNGENADLLSVVRYTVEEKDADVFLRTSQGRTAADFALIMERQ